MFSFRIAESQPSYTFHYVLCAVAAPSETVQFGVFLCVLYVRSYSYRTTWVGTYVPIHCSFHHVRGLVLLPDVFALSYGVHVNEEPVYIVNKRSFV